MGWSQELRSEPSFQLRSTEDCAIQGAMSGRKKLEIHARIMIKKSEVILDRSDVGPRTKAILRNNIRAFKSFVNGQVECILGQLQELPDPTHDPPEVSDGTSN